MRTFQCHVIAIASSRWSHYAILQWLLWLQRPDHLMRVPKLQHKHTFSARSSDQYCGQAILSTTRSSGVLILLVPAQVIVPYPVQWFSSPPAFHCNIFFVLLCGNLEFFGAHSLHHRGSSSQHKMHWIFTLLGVGHVALAPFWPQLSSLTTTVVILDFTILLYTINHSKSPQKKNRTFSPRYRLFIGMV